MARLKEYNDHYCESEYEYAFIGFLEAEGWKYSSGNNIRRVTKRDVLIVDDFKKFIADINPDLTEDEVTQVYDNVRLVGAESDFATLHKVYGWMVNGVQFTPQDGLPRMIPLIEFDNWDKNIFRVVNQFTVEYTNNGQKENRRPDVLLFVNGMPLCVIELKNPADANATIYDAWEQINIRYWRDIPHLLHYCPCEGKSIVEFSVKRRVERDSDSDYSEQIVPFQIAYAVSIHKAQGLEYKSVKVVITEDIDEKISHNIFYTAITRTTDKLKIYMSKETQKKLAEKFVKSNVGLKQAQLFAGQAGLKLKNKLSS